MSCIMVLTVTVLMISMTPQLPAQSSHCADPPSGNLGMVKYLQNAAQYGTAADLSAMQIPQTTDVELLSSESLCTAAASAYNTDVSGSNPHRKVLVIRVGTVYVVTDPLLEAGEYGVHVTYSDSAFTQRLVRFLH